MGKSTSSAPLENSADGVVLMLRTSLEARAGLRQS